MARNSRVLLRQLLGNRMKPCVALIHHHNLKNPFNIIQTLTTSVPITPSSPPRRPPPLAISSTSKSFCTLDSSLKKEIIIGSTSRWSINYKGYSGIPLILLNNHYDQYVRAVKTIQDESLPAIILFTTYYEASMMADSSNFLYSRLDPLKLKFALTSSFPLKTSSNSHSSTRVLRKEYIVTTMFIGNFIGIVCVISLHYQFYFWYFHSLPYLLWKTPFPTVLRVMLFIGLKFWWNIFPSSMYSSAMLLFLHLVILVGLWSAPPEYPYVDDIALTENKDTGCCIY